jgi:hypothetical protein
MSGYESPRPESEIDGDAMGAATADGGAMADGPMDGSGMGEGAMGDGAMGAGAAEAPDLAAWEGGDATGGGSPGDPDAMGTDDEVQLDELP